MKSVIALLYFALLAGNASATAQFPDLLLYKGERQAIFTNPLESYFDKQHSRPQDLFEFTCTANWRGYVATWKIEGDFLYLVKLVDGSCRSDAPEIPIEKVFPGQQAPIKASWFSGVLRIPRGEELEYVHMGYESLYEKDLLLTIENGRLVKERLVDNRTRKILSEEVVSGEEPREAE